MFHLPSDWLVFDRLETAVAVHDPGAGWRAAQSTSRMRAADLGPK